MELQEIKYIYIVCFFFILYSCSTIKYYDLKQLRDLPPTHDINSSLLYKAFDNVSESGELDYFDTSKNIICINISRDDTLNQISIGIWIDDFHYSQMTYSSTQLKQVGYSYYNKYPVLIFGDTTRLFKRNKQVAIKQVLAYKNNNEIPMIYESRIYRYEVINDKLEVLNRYKW